MSIFNEETPTTEATSESQKTSFLEVLVANKGEKFRDVEELAKSKLEADRYIEELKSKVKSQEYVESLVAELKKPQASTAQASTQEETSNTQTNENTTPAVGDLESQIASVLAKREQENKAKANLARVEEQLKEAYGDEATSVLNKKAQELGIAKEKLAALAAESPDAFLKLVDAPSFTPQNNSVVKPTVNTTNMNSSTGARNSAYYAKLRKDNPKIINDPTYHKQMLIDRMALGDKW